jgi:hypothetical protein
MGGRKIALETLGGIHQGMSSIMLFIWWLEQSLHSLQIDITKRVVQLSMTDSVEAYQIVFLNILFRVLHFVNTV